MEESYLGTSASSLLVTPAANTVHKNVYGHVPRLCSFVNMYNEMDIHNIERYTYITELIISGKVTTMQIRLGFSVFQK